MWSWIDFANTALASLAGSALAAFVAWLVYLSERAGRREAAEAQAVGRSFDAAAQYCRDLWAHQQAFKQIDVVARGNAWTANADFRPDDPVPATAIIVTRAELAQLKSENKRVVLVGLLAALEDTKGDWHARVDRIGAASGQLLSPQKVRKEVVADKSRKPSSGPR